MPKKSQSASAYVDIQNFNLSILGVSVPVRFMDKVFDGNNIEASGLFHLVKDKPVIEISLSANKNHDEISHTLFHELFHATCYVLGVQNCQLSHDLEEILADNLGRVWKDNFKVEF